MRTSIIIAIAVIVAVIIQTVIITPFRVPSPSMVPNVLVGDYVLVEKSAYGLRLPFTDWWPWGIHEIQRGDIVVFHHTHEGRSQYYIKRIIGLPGDTIVVDGHTMRINDILLDHDDDSSSGKENNPFLKTYWETNGNHRYHVQYARHEQSQRLTHTVVPGMFFAMGDNRNQSTDSRTWGAIPQTQIVGRVTRILGSRDPLTRRWRSHRWNYEVQ